MVAYASIEHSQLNLAEIAVEKAAVYEDKLKRGHRGDEALGARLSCEYHFLRIALVSLDIVAPSI